METFIILLVIFGSITVHEFAHAKSAEMAGDPTPRMYGRVTLNPMAHFDPAGFIMIIITAFAGFGIGWGKPVPINPQMMHSPRWDSLLVTAWGPFSNFLMAIVAAILLKFLAIPSGNEFLFLFCMYAVVINVCLGLFNLIPLFPLDGSWIVKELLPPYVGGKFFLWNVRYGAFILLACVLLLPLFGFHPVSMVLRPFQEFVLRFLLAR